MAQFEGESEDLGSSNGVIKEIKLKARRGEKRTRRVYFEIGFVERVEDSIHNTG